MVNIKKQLVPNSIGRKVTAGYNNSKKYITIHQTGNTSRGADAQAHANLQSKGNSRYASWQYQVDDKGAIQSFDDNAQCFHAGDGRGPGNMSSIGIELCINSDGNYRKTVENGAELVRHLMDKHNIPISNVKQHNHWSGKNCPAQIRANKDGISWADFLNMVRGKTVTAQAPKQQAKSTSKPKTSTYTGDSIVEYLNSIKVSSSFANRKQLAKQYGINNYTGTASQNTQLLNKIRGKTPKKNSSKKSLPNTVYIARKPYPNGSGVRAVQEALASVYFYPDKGAKNNGVDGYYGPKTADAVRRFQSIYLPDEVDGVYGKNTKRELEKRSPLY